MNYKKWNSLYLFIFLQFAGIGFFSEVDVCPSYSAGYPVGNIDQNSQTLLKNERKLPNGTVLGKYTYSDKDGNPIEVKYYADSSSYGVELNSVKIVDPDKMPSAIMGSTESSDDEDLSKDVPYSQLKTGRKMTKPLDSKKKLPVVDIEVSYPTIPNKYKPLDTYDYLNRDIKKNNHYKPKKLENPRPDYDIYFQNELKGDNNCHSNEEEEVKLYFNEPSRNIRSALDDSFDADKYCEQIMM